MIEKNVNINLLKNIFSRYKKDYELKRSDFTKIYAYIIDGIIVGFLVFDIIYDRCEIIDIYVDEKYRRKSIAQKLIKEILEDYDFENITLEVSSINIPAIKLYEKLGFKKEAIRKNYYNDSDGILMLKEIR